MFICRVTLPVKVFPCPSAASQACFAYAPGSTLAVLISKVGSVQCWGCESHNWRTPGGTWGLRRAGQRLTHCLFPGTPPRGCYRRPREGGKVPPPTSSASFRTRRRADQAPCGTRCKMCFQINLTSAHSFSAAFASEPLVQRFKSCLLLQ